MDSGYLPRHEHEEFAKRMEEEHRRQNKRIGDLEDGQKERHRMLVSIEKMAVNMEEMQKEQKEQGERLEILENRDGEKWRETTKYVLFTCLGILISFVMKEIGIF